LSAGLPAPPGWSIDPVTLREVPDSLEELERSIAALRERLEQAGLTAAEELSLRGRLGGEARIAGRLELALEVLAGALELAGRAGTPRDRILAALRLAHVHQWRAEWARSDALFAACLAESNRALGQRDRSFVHQHAGKNLFDQGRWAEAAAEFGAALALREALGDEPLAESSRLALAAARENLSR
jgi:hypothetical protein